MPRDETLLESQLRPEAHLAPTSSSPRLDAIDIASVTNEMPSSQPQYLRHLDMLQSHELSRQSGIAPPMGNDLQSWPAPVGQENPPQLFPLDWSTWLLDGLGPPWPDNGSVPF